jgi:GNAT superfamily N-acetyltransferase
MLFQNKNKESFEITPATENDVAWIEDNMKLFDKDYLPEENIQHINYLVKDANKESIGGILAMTRYNTVCINTIWIRSDYRKKGIGKYLIELVENKAKEYGCIISSLGTFEKFETKEFYESLGYRVVSTSIDSPPGHIGYWFNKSIK